MAQTIVKWNLLLYLSLRAVEILCEKKNTASSSSQRWGQTWEGHAPNIYSIFNFYHKTWCESKIIFSPFSCSWIFLFLFLINNKTRVYICTIKRALYACQPEFKINNNHKRKVASRYTLRLAVILTSFDDVYVRVYVYIPIHIPEQRASSSKSERKKNAFHRATLEKRHLACRERKIHFRRISFIRTVYIRNFNNQNREKNSLSLTLFSNWTTKRFVCVALLRALHYKLNVIFNDLLGGFFFFF